MKWKLTSPGDIRFIGLKNYRNILQSDSFWYSMQNTVYILVLVIVLTTILGCLVAAFLKISKKCSGILLALAILPWALPPEPLDRGGKTKELQEVQLWTKRRNYGRRLKRKEII